MVAQQNRRKYLSVAHWEKLQYHKKLENPPWTRLHQAWLTDYGFSQLSLQQWGVLFGMHMLAARTGNKIPYDPAWIAKQFSKRSSPVSKVILNLISTGFLLEFEEVPDSKENSHLRFISSADATFPEGEGEGDSDSDSDSKGGASADGARTTVGADDNDSDPNGLETDVPLSLPTPSRTRTRQSESIGVVMSNRGSRGKDPRSWDQLTDAARPIVRKYGITEADQLFIMAGRSLGLSKKQCPPVIDRLKQEGTI